MSDRKEQTPLCFLVMFFSLLNVLYQAVFMGSVSGENHRDNPPFFPPLLAMSFYNHSVLSPVFTNVSYRQLSFPAQHPSCTQVHFSFKVHTDFSNTCSLIVNGIARFLLAWQTRKFGTNKIIRIIIVPIYGTL